MTPAPPDELLALVAGALRVSVTTPPAPTSGGFSHLTFRVGLGGRACVVKAASVAARRDEVRNEAAMLRRVAGVVPVPSVVAVVDEGEWTALVTVEVPGTHGLEVIRGATVVACAERLGAALSTLHALGLVHGDAGFHNTVWDESRALVALLDWEWGGEGPPLVDLAWVWWTMQFRSLDPFAWAAFVGGYGPLVDWSHDAVLASVRAHMDRHLARVAGDDALTAEWQRRRAALADLAVPPAS